jgi:hypothetical protein
MTLHITFWPTNFVQFFFKIDEISYVFIVLKILNEYYVSMLMKSKYV